MRFSAALPSGSQLHVPCEVKQAHARDLWTAPGDQLAARYMREPAVRYGFYLVGWYGISTRPDPVSRKKLTDPHVLGAALQDHVDRTLDSSGRKIIVVVYDLTLCKTTEDRREIHN